MGVDKKPDPLIVMVVEAVLIPKFGSMDEMTGTAALPVLGRIRHKTNNIEHMSDMKDLLYIYKPSACIDEYSLIVRMFKNILLIKPP